MNVDDKDELCMDEIIITCVGITYEQIKNPQSLCPPNGIKNRERNFWEHILARKECQNISNFKNLQKKYKEISTDIVDPWKLLETLKKDPITFKLILTIVRNLLLSKIPSERGIIYELIYRFCKDKLNNLGRNSSVNLFIELMDNPNKNLRDDLYLGKNEDENFAKACIYEVIKCHSIFGGKSLKDHEYSNQLTRIKTVFVLAAFYQITNTTNGLNAFRKNDSNNIIDKYFKTKPTSEKYEENLLKVLDEFETKFKNKFDSAQKMINDLINESCKEDEEDEEEKTFQSEVKSDDGNCDGCSEITFRTDEEEQRHGPYGKSILQLIPTITHLENENANLKNENTNLQNEIERLRNEIERLNWNHHQTVELNQTYQEPQLEENIMLLSPTLDPIIYARGRFSCTIS